MSGGRGHVVLGVCGGIAAYKAPEILRGFQRAGWQVHACLTEAAARFVSPLTFSALSGNPVSHGRVSSEADMAHVEMTRGAALFVVAPATANTLGRFAAGLADDWLGAHFLANEAPVLLAPAMNQRMWRHPAVQANLATLVARGAVVVPPGEGDLACGEVGPGRLADPDDIVARGLLVLSGSTELAGRTVLVTSGPTVEDVDAARVITNRSSGRMGHAVAREAARRGARVVLVTGPVHVPDPPGCEVVRVRSAEDMAQAVAAAIPGADISVFAAAVADFRPRPVAGKLRRGQRERLVLELERTRDILAEAVAARAGGILVGFAAEVGSVVPAARRKLARKGCHLLVANRIDGPEPAFEDASNEVVLLWPDGKSRKVSRAPKEVIAAAILDAAQDLLRGRRRPRARRP